MKFESERQRKIKVLIALINGEIVTSEIPPRFLLRINPDGMSTYSINGKGVNKIEFHKQLDTQPALCNLKTIGREDDQAEYYY